MNFPLALTSKTRLFLTAIAAVALIAILAGVAAGSASASGGGGVSPGGAVSGGKDGKSGKGGKKGSTTRADESSYKRLWMQTSGADKRWAKTTSECESGGDPKAIGGGGAYRGAFQFMKSTWRTSPKSPGGDPIVYSYRTQAVVALLLRERDGEGHWPVCG